jgi:hypothetical protein
MPHEQGKEAFKEFTRRVRNAVGGNDKSASHDLLERTAAFYQLALHRHSLDCYYPTATPKAPRPS